MNNTLLQTEQFLYMIYAGVFMGFFYDLCALLRGEGGIWRDALCDLLFWVLALSAALWALYRAAWLQFSWQAPLGFGLGAAAYHWTLGRIFHRCTAFFEKILDKIYTFLANMLK